MFKMIIWVNWPFMLLNIDDYHCLDLVGSFWPSTTLEKNLKKKMKKCKELLKEKGDKHGSSENKIFVFLCLVQDARMSILIGSGLQSYHCLRLTFVW